MATLNMIYPTYLPRFLQTQRNRTLNHHMLPQPSEEDEKRHLSAIHDAEDFKNSSERSKTLIYCQPCIPNEDPEELISEVEMAEELTSEIESHSPGHTFVVCADSQLGMTSLNEEWETELSYCRAAVQKINALEPRPAFVSMCGDIVDMEQSFYYNNPKALRSYDLPECERKQRKQFADFQQVFDEVHEDIAVVCLCGNHDIGNRPTPKSIEKYRDAFGDEYLAFWVNGTYNIVLNNVLFANPDGAKEIFLKQLEWLEERLEYANRHKAAQIYVFGHHPWFLYHEDEDVADFVDSVGSAFPKEWDDGSGRFDNTVFPDLYFSVPKEQRRIALELFKKYNVNASFSGHFHQNLVSKTSFGMDMIVTGPLSMVFDSKGKPIQDEPHGRGIRVVDVSVDMDAEKRATGKNGSFKHRFELI